MKTELEVEADDGPAKRGQGFPAIPLGRAVEMLDILYKSEGEHPVPVTVAAQRWGYGPKSSGWMQAVGAIKTFGLASDEGSRARRTISMTPLARRILLDKRELSPEREKALREAALRPAMHQAIWQYFAGKLPSESNLEHYLIFNCKLKETAAKVQERQFRSTIAYAGLDKENSGVTANAATPPPVKGASSGSLPRVIASGTAVVSVGLPNDPTMREFPFTLPSLTVATLQLPFPMTAEDFEALEDWLRRVKGKLTAVAVQTSAPAPEAKEASDG